MGCSLLLRGLLSSRPYITAQTEPPSTGALPRHGLKTDRTCRILAIAPNRPRSDRIWCSHRAQGPSRSGSTTRTHPAEHDAPPASDHRDPSGLKSLAFSSRTMPDFFSHRCALQCSGRSSREEPAFMQQQQQAAEFGIDEARRVLGEVFAPWVMDLNLSIEGFDFAPPPGRRPTGSPARSCACRFPNGCAAMAAPSAARR